VFCYTSWRFYAFSGTNLLTRRHSASSLFFCCFCVSEKLHRKYSWNWTEQNPNLLFFPKWDEVRRWDGGGPGASHNLGWRGPGPGHATRGEAAWSTSWRRPSAYIFPSMRKTKTLINFPRNILQAAAVVDARSGGSRSSSWHPAGGLLHHHGRLQSDVSSLPWTMGP
jgi:hypothetical protein